MLMSAKIKDFLKKINIVSECCNGSGAAPYERDDWNEFLVKRVEKLERDYEKCRQHQDELRREITSLLAHLARMNESPRPSTAQHLEGT